MHVNKDILTQAMDMVMGPELPLIRPNRTAPSNKSLARASEKRSATAPLATADDVVAADRAMANLLAELELEERNTQTTRKNTKTNPKRK